MLTSKIVEYGLVSVIEESIANTNTTEHKIRHTDQVLTSQ